MYLQHIQHTWMLQPPLEQSTPGMQNTNTTQHAMLERENESRTYQGPTVGVTDDTCTQNYSYCSTGTNITGMGWGYVATPITGTISSLVHKWHIKSEPHPWYRGGYQTKSRLRVSLSLTHMLNTSWYSDSKIQTLNIRLFTQKIVIFHNGKM